MIPQPVFIDNALCYNPPTMPLYYNGDPIQQGGSYEVPRHRKFGLKKSLLGKVPESLTFLSGEVDPYGDIVAIYYRPIFFSRDPRVVRAEAINDDSECADNNIVWLHDPQEEHPFIERIPQGLTPSELDLYSRVGTLKVDMRKEMATLESELNIWLKNDDMGNVHYTNSDALAAYYYKRMSEVKWRYLFQGIAPGNWNGYDEQGRPYSTDMDREGWRSCAALLHDLEEVGWFSQTLLNMALLYPIVLNTGVGNDHLLIRGLSYRGDALEPLQLAYILSRKDIQHSVKLAIVREQTTKSKNYHRTEEATVMAQHSNSKLLGQRLLEQVYSAL